MISANYMRQIAHMITQALALRSRKKLGFFLIVFPFHAPGVANYITNAERETMLTALKEQIRILEQGNDFPTPEEN